MESSSFLALKLWAFTCATLASVICLFNVVIDPYLVFGTSRVPYLNMRKPAIETQHFMMKAYDVERKKPNTVLLGSSRVGWGMDSQDIAWPTQYRPVYNLSVPGGYLPYSYLYLQHLLSKQQLKLVVIGLDFEHFYYYKHGPISAIPSDLKGRLAVSWSGEPNPEQGAQRVRDIVFSALSLDALIDSRATVAANWQDISSDLLEGNWVHEDNFRPGSGSYAQAALFDLSRTLLLRESREQRPLHDQSGLIRLRRILDLCASKKIDVVLFLHPLHVDYLELEAFWGFWERFEQWKREVLALTELYSGPHQRNNVTLWDFSDYNLYSTEEFPIEGSASYWFEPVHFTPALGHEIITRLVGRRGPDDFGMRLTPKSIDAWLANIRDQQHRYRQNHETGVRRRFSDLEKLLVTHSPPTPPSQSKRYLVVTGLCASAVSGGRHRHPSPGCRDRNP